MAISRNLFLLTALIVVLFLSPIAAFAADSKTPDAGQQITDGLKIAFGVASTTPDTMLWVRFAIFILAITLISTLMMSISLFKEKTTAGIVIGVIISYIAVRFMPDSAIAVLVIFMPILFVIGFFVMLFQAITSKELGLGGQSKKAKYIIMFIAGFITLLVLYQMTTSISEAIPAVTKSSFWPYFTVATLLGLIISSLAIIIMLFYGGQGFLKKMGDAFRDSKGIERDIRREMMDIRKDAIINNKVHKIAGNIGNQLSEMENAITKGDWNYAAAAIGKIENELNTELKILNNEKAVLARDITRAKDAIQKAKREGADTRTLDTHIMNAESRIEVVEASLIRLENYKLALIENGYAEVKALAGDIQAKNFAEANKRIQLIKSQLNKIRAEDLLESQELNALNRLANVALARTYDEVIKDRQDYLVQNELRRLPPILLDIQNKTQSAMRTLRSGPQFQLEKKANGLIGNVIIQLNRTKNASPPQVLTELDTIVADLKVAIQEVEQVEHMPGGAGTPLVKKYMQELRDLNEALQIVDDAIARERKVIVEMKRD